LLTDRLAQNGGGDETFVTLATDPFDLSLGIPASSSDGSTEFIGGQLFPVPAGLEPAIEFWKNLH
jgi:hypothetical protein